MVWFGLDIIFMFTVVWYGMVGCGEVWYGTVWFGYNIYVYCGKVR